MNLTDKKQILERQWNESAKVYSDRREALRKAEDLCRDAKLKLFNAKQAFLKHVEEIQGLIEDDDCHE